MAATHFTDIMNFVNTQSQIFISSKTAAVAAALSPAATTLMGCYMLLWGFAHIRGMVQEPMMEFVSRVIKIVAVYGIGIGMWNYNEYIVDTIMNSPDMLANALAGGGNGTTLSSLDRILSDIFDVGNTFYKNAGVLSGNIGGYLAAFIVWLAGLAVTCYAAFLNIMAKIFCSALIALGPLFIIALFFEATSKFFESWVAQVSNYALLVPLTTAVNVFILSMLQDVAAQAQKSGGSVKIADIFPLLIVGGISLLVLAQVPGVASGLAGGIAVSSYGVGRKLAGSGMKTAKWSAKQASKPATKMAQKGYAKAKSAYNSRRNNVSKSSRTRSEPSTSKSSTNNTPATKAA